MYNKSYPLSPNQDEAASAEFALVDSDVISPSEQEPSPKRHKTDGELEDDEQSAVLLTEGTREQITLPLPVGNSSGALSDISSLAPHQNSTSSMAIPADQPADGQPHGQTTNHHVPNQEGYGSNNVAVLGGHIVS